MLAQRFNQLVELYIRYLGFCSEEGTFRRQFHSVYQEREALEQKVDQITDELEGIQATLQRIEAQCAALVTSNMDAAAENQLAHLAEAILVFQCKKLQLERNIRKYNNEILDLMCTPAYTRMRRIVINRDLVKSELDKQMREVLQDYLPDALRSYPEYFDYEIKQMFKPFMPKLTMQEFVANLNQILHSHCIYSLSLQSYLDQVEQIVRSAYWNQANKTTTPHSEIAALRQLFDQRSKLGDAQLAERLTKFENVISENQAITRLLNGIAKKDLVTIAAFLGRIEILAEMQTSPTNSRDDRPSVAELTTDVIDELIFSYYKVEEAEKCIQACEQKLRENEEEMKKIPGERARLLEQHPTLRDEINKSMDKKAESLKANTTIHEMLFKDNAREGKNKLLLRWTALMLQHQDQLKHHLMMARLCKASFFTMQQRHEPVEYSVETQPVLLF